MLSIFQKFYLWVGILLVSTYSVFACINDAYTSRSETLWGSYYSNAFEINLITTVLVILFESYFIIRLFRLHNKNQTVKTEKFFTLFMLFLSWFFISCVILYWGLLELLFGIFVLFFFAYYVCISIYQVYLLIKQNTQCINYKEIAFLGLLLVYVWFIFFIIFEWISFRGVTRIMLVTLTYWILVYSLFIIKYYRHKICTIIILTLLILESFPLYLRFMEDFSIKTPQHQKTNIHSFWSTR